MDLRQLTATTRDGLPISLTPFTGADVERVHELCQDPEIQRWTTVPSPYPPEAAEGFVNEYAATAWRQLEAGTLSVEQAGPALVWGVRVGEGSPLTGLWGSIGLKLHGDRELEIGWWLGAGARGHGIMRAAVARLVETAFSPEAPLRATAVHWYAFLGNLPSAAVAQRTGFGYTGVTDHLGRPHWSAIIHPGDPIAPRDDWPALADQA